LWYDIINKTLFVVTALLELQASWDSSDIFLLGSTDGYSQMLLSMATAISSR